MFSSFSPGPFSEPRLFPDGVAHVCLRGVHSSPSHPPSASSCPLQEATGLLLPSLTRAAVGLCPGRALRIPGQELDAAGRCWVSWLCWRWRRSLFRTNHFLDSPSCHLVLTQGSVGCTVSSQSEDLTFNENVEMGPEAGTWQVSDVLSLASE